MVNVLNISDLQHFARTGGKVNEIEPPESRNRLGLNALDNLQEALQECANGDYDGKLTRRYMLGIIDDARVAMGGARMTPDEFNDLLGGDKSEPQ